MFQSLQDFLAKVRFATVDCATDKAVAVVGNFVGNSPGVSH